METHNCRKTFSPVTAEAPPHVVLCVTEPNWSGDTFKRPVNASRLPPGAVRATLLPLCVGHGGCGMRSVEEASVKSAGAAEERVPS